MYPKGFYGIESLHIVLPLVVIFGTLMQIWLLRREGLPIARLLLLQSMVLVFGLIGAKLFSLYVRDWQTFDLLRHELRSGWRYPGGILAIIISIPLAKKWILPNISLAHYGDVLAISACFGMALFRFSCFMNGCCVGAVCNEWYCLPYSSGSQVWYQHLQAGLLEHPHDSSLHVLPLHFLFMAAAFTITLFLLWYLPRKRFNGEMILLFLALHEGAKGLLESLRAPAVAELQIASLSISALSILLLVYCYRKYATAPSPATL